MLPLTFLAVLVSLTLLALAGQALERRRVVRVMRKLARDWRLHYADADRFQITCRVREQFPVPGASDLVIADLLYRQEHHLYRYLFTVEYTLGVIRTKRRVRRAATIAEPRDPASGTDWSPLMLAPQDLPLLEQYAYLHNRQPDAAPASGPVEEAPPSLV